MKLKLDTKTVAGLELGVGRTEEFVWDTELEGFGVRLRRGQRGGLQRSWIVQYRSGRSRRVTLGAVETVPVSQAREAGRKILARVVLGEDPQAERNTKRLQAARTFRAVVDAYLAARQRELEPMSYRIAKLYLTGPYFRPLHAMAIAHVSHADIAARLSAISRNHSPNTAAATRRAIMPLFRWAMEEGWLAANPVIGTRRPPRAAPRD